MSCVGAAEGPIDALLSRKLTKEEIAEDMGRFNAGGF
jgi:hypothetical protein